MKLVFQHSLGIDRWLFPAKEIARKEKGREPDAPLVEGTAKRLSEEARQAEQAVSGFLQGRADVLVYTWPERNRRVPRWRDGLDDESSEDVG